MSHPANLCYLGHAMSLIENLKAHARTRPQRIVLSEGEDPRNVSAAASITREGFAKITLLGKTSIVESIAADLDVSLSGIAIVDPSASPRVESYAQKYYE